MTQQTVARNIIGGKQRQRMMLDAAPWSMRKLSVETAKQAIWRAFSLWNGFTFVGYCSQYRATNEKSKFSMP